MNKKIYGAELGATAGCAARLVKNTRYCGNHYERNEAKQNKKKEIIYGDLWFGSKVSFFIVLF